MENKSATQLYNTTYNPNSRTHSRSNTQTHSSSLVRKREQCQETGHTLLCQHTTRTHFTEMAWPFRKVRALHNDVKGHLEDLLELWTMKDGIFTRMSAL